MPQSVRLSVCVSVCRTNEGIGDVTAFEFRRRAPKFVQLPFGFRPRAADVVQRRDSKDVPHVQRSSAFRMQHIRNYIHRFFVYNHLYKTYDRCRDVFIDECVVNENKSPYRSQITACKKEALVGIELQTNLS